MKNNKDFYIGWQDKMATSQRRFLRVRIIFLFVALPILVFLLVFFQKPFTNHSFELGNIKEVTGTYFEDPYPILVADNEVLPKGLPKYILLVGYGKFGAHGIMHQIQESHGDLKGKKITLTGTLIYGDGKTLMELTKKTDSFVEIKSNSKAKLPNMTELELVEFSGEILDPKCYFGVMKPGEGKIHKSCAIRCISGGIPPVFRKEKELTESSHRYFLMVNEKGRPVKNEILDFVGERISIQGRTGSIPGWEILYIDAKEMLKQ
jgi:hypothetical protein